MGIAIWLAAWVFSSFIISRKTKSITSIIGGGLIGSLVVVILIYLPDIVIAKILQPKPDPHRIVSRQKPKPARIQPVPAPKIEPKILSRQEQIEKEFSTWDGSHRGLERIIKKGMNDPDSYKHVETRYSDQGSYLIVKTTFRGKNAFGAMMLNSIVAKTDLEGNVLEIISMNK